MEKYILFEGIVVFLDWVNVDMDLIILKQFLKFIKCIGFGFNLFDELCYFDEGQFGQDCVGRLINIDFVFNKLCYKNVGILLVRCNFGCGLSWEYVFWVLMDFGFCMVLVFSFVDIFFNNSFKNGLLFIVLEEYIIDQLFVEVEVNEGYKLIIDLVNQIIIKVGGEQIFFEVDLFCKYCLFEGLDDIGLIL